MAGAGALAGSMKDKVTQSNSSGVSLDPASQLETRSRDTLGYAFNDFTNMVNAGPGQSDVTAGYDAQKSFANLLDQYSKGAYNPNESDISSANDLYAKLFAPQRTALQQAFEDQNQSYARQAALMGRDVNDPVFRAKLAFQQSRDQQLLRAQQNSAAMQYALQQPFQRLDFAAQRTNALSGLATQAMANRQALASMGEGIMNDERNFRIQTASHWGNQTTESGGGLKGALQGAIAGAGTGASIASGMGGFGGAGGGMQAAPAVMPAQSFSTPMMYGQAPQAYDGGRSYGLMGRSSGYQQPNLFASQSPYMFAGR